MENVDKANAVSKSELIETLGVLHRDMKISPEQWKLMCLGMTLDGMGRAANWLIHGMVLRKLDDGCIKMERRDYAEKNQYLLLDTDGNYKILPLQP